MDQTKLRERALELRGFIHGYHAAKEYGGPPYSQMTLTFLDDLLRADLDQSTGGAEVLQSRAEVSRPDAASEPTCRPCPQVVGDAAQTEPDATPGPQARDESSESALLPPAVQSDEAKIQAFLAARVDAQSEVGSASPTTKRQNWSPEARAAAAERMRARRAAGLMKRRGGQKSAQEATAPEPQTIILKHGNYGEQTRNAEPPRVSLAKPMPLAEPPPPHRLTISHADWAGKREDSQLHDSDWPDIREMMDQGRTRLAIATDFDVEPETLDAFIAARSGSKVGEVEMPPGEPRAPLA